jgi:integrase
MYAAYVLVLITGLRRGEVLGMTWDRVDLDRQEMTPSMALQLRQAEQDRHKKAIKGRWPDRANLVFTSRYGKPIEPRNFNRSFTARCEKAGVRRIRLHDTRHTCGSMLAALGVHPRVAMQILRHSKINVTMEIYTHVPDAVTRDALKKLADRIQGEELQ